MDEQAMIEYLRNWRSIMNSTNLKLSKRPERKTVIDKDDIINIQIALGQTKDVIGFIKSI